MVIGFMPDDFSDPENPPIMLEYYPIVNSSGYMKSAEQDAGGRKAMCWCCKKLLADPNDQSIFLPLGS